MEEYIIQALNLECFSKEYMDRVVDFIKPYQEKLLNFEYMILHADSFEECYGKDSGIEIDRNEDVVVYRNIHNVKWQMTNQRSDKTEGGVDNA